MTEVRTYLTTVELSVEDTCQEYDVSVAYRVVDGVLKILAVAHFQQQVDLSGLVPILSLSDGLRALLRQHWDCCERAERVEADWERQRERAQEPPAPS